MRDILRLSSFRKAKTKAMTIANHSKEIITRSQRELEVKIGKLVKARENASEQFAIGFSFEYDWWRK